MDGFPGKIIGPILIFSGLNEPFLAPAPRSWLFSSRYALLNYFLLPRFLFIFDHFVPFIFELLEFSKVHLKLYFLPLISQLIERSRFWYRWRKHTRLLLSLFQAQRRQSMLLITVAHVNWRINGLRQ